MLRLFGWKSCFELSTFNFILIVIIIRKPPQQVQSLFLDTFCIFGNDIGDSQFDSGTEDAFENIGGFTDQQFLR